MVRDNLREGPCADQEAAGAEAALACFRVNGASGRTMTELAGLAARPLEDTDELKGLSQGFVCFLDVPGLIDDDAEAE